MKVYPRISELLTSAALTYSLLRAWIEDQDHDLSYQLFLVEKHWATQAEEYEGRWNEEEADALRDEEESEVIKAHAQKMAPYLAALEHLAGIVDMEEVARLEANR